MRRVMQFAVLLLFWALWLGASPHSAFASEPSVLVIPQAEVDLFWDSVRRGAEDAAAERGARVIYRGPMTRDEYRSQQAAIVDAADKVDAIVIAPSHSAGVAEALNRARDRGIAVVVIDSALEGTGYSSFISTDNAAAGRKAAKYLLDNTPDDAPILLLRHLEGTSSTMERERGFSEAAESRGRGGKLVVSEYLGISPGNAYRRTLELLREHPEVRAVFAPAELVTTACIKALRELKLAGRVTAVGFDLTPESRRALSDGTLSALMVQQPYRMGYLGVTTACDVLLGKKVRNRIVTEARLVTRVEDLGSAGK